MTSTEVKNLTHQYVMNTYGRFDVAIERGEGATLYDPEGREYIDFTSFSKLHTDVKTNNCKIMHAEWTQLSEHEWVFTIQADRFLRNMVRAVVGTLVEVGRGKMTLDGFRQVIEKKNRCSAGSSVPGHALFLVDVGYPEELFI